MSTFDDLCNAASLYFDNENDSIDERERSPPARLKKFTPLIGKRSRLNCWFGNTIEFHDKPSHTCCQKCHCLYNDDKDTDSEYNIGFQRCNSFNSLPTPKNTYSEPATPNMSLMNNYSNSVLLSSDSFNTVFINQPNLQWKRKRAREKHAPLPKDHPYVVEYLGCMCLEGKCDFCGNTGKQMKDMFVYDNKTMCLSCSIMKKIPENDLSYFVQPGECDNKNKSKSIQCDRCKQWWNPSCFIKYQKNTQTYVIRKTCSFCCLKSSWLYFKRSD